MRKNLLVVYDDTRKPCREISVITGKKGFGEIIYKRQTLCDRARSLWETVSCNVLFVEAVKVTEVKVDGDTPVILMYSDFVCKDKEELEVLAVKALCSHENYAFVQDGRVACVIFNDYKSFTNAHAGDIASYPVINGESFLDISEVNAFRAFITGGFEARFFNSMKADEMTVVKSSDKKAKIKAEYTFYELLPDDMKMWFVRPFNYVEDGNRASYTMERYHMTDLAIRYIHGAISVEEFEDILKKLFYFVNGRKEIEISREEYEKNAENLYIKKVDERIAELKEAKDYDKLAQMIGALTKYSSIDEIVSRYKELYRKITSNTQQQYVKTVSHGDLCFSNILYSKEASLLKLIDPKGAISSEDLYMNPYYDIAKLSHSICGHYDFYNSDLYEIAVDSELTGKLKVDADNRDYVMAFKNKLEENGIDFKLIRIYETSLFISMLPFHMDRPRKVLAFILNAIAIMDSLEQN